VDGTTIPRVMLEQVELLLTNFFFKTNKEVTTQFFVVASFYDNTIPSAIDFNQYRTMIAVFRFR